MSFKDTILYEDETILVCNKPAGLMVEPDRNNFPNLLQQVKHYLKETTGKKDPYAQHLHRLDRPVSGIVLFTKQKEHLRNLSEQFAKRKVSKYYIALTSKYNSMPGLHKDGQQNLSAETSKTYILEHWHRKEKKKAVLVPEGTEFAEKVKLEYTTEPYKGYLLWNIKLHTGKYHQIRVQLASLGFPILGDALYGSTETYKQNAIALHAAKLIITHPVSGKEMVFEAEFDPGFENLSHQ